MISKVQAQELSKLSYLIHTQILTEHGNVLNHPHELALRAIHETLAGMVCGESSEWHGRWGLSAPVGFGKSSAIAAFISAAYQLGLLGNGITMTLTAARVGQLFDFEHALLSNGIPKAEIRKFVSVVYFTSKKAAGVERDADTNYDAPILLVSHNKIRQVYRQDEKYGFRQRDLVYFLKAHGEPRDLVVWDERCSVTEPISLDLKDLKQAIGAFRAYDEDGPFMQWLSVMYRQLDQAAEVASTQHAEVILEGIVERGHLGRYFELLQRTPGLLRDARTKLYLLIDLLKFPIRVLPNGVLSYKVVVPDCMENVLVLDASFEVSALSKIDTSIQNLEDAHPLLLKIQKVYKKRLKDLKDCSDLTFVHWSKGAGKDVVECDARAYLDGAAVEGNVIHETVEWLKPRVAEGKPVLVCTHKSGANGADIGELVKRCLVKVFDLNTTIEDHFDRTPDNNPTVKPQVTVETYGRLDASNEFSYCSVVVHVGVQERNDLDLSAAIVGQKRDLRAVLTADEIKQAKLTEKAVVFQQSNGRGQSRVVIDGKALPQETFAIYPDRKNGNLTDLLKPLYWGATWTEHKKPRPRKEGSTARWTKIVKAYLNGLPEDVAKVSSQTLRVEVNAKDVPDGTWKDVLKSVREDQTFLWQLQCRTFQRLFTTIAA